MKYVLGSASCSCSVCTKMVGRSLVVGKVNGSILSPRFPFFVVQLSGTCSSSSLLIRRSHFGRFGLSTRSIDKSSIIFSFSLSCCSHATQPTTIHVVVYLKRSKTPLRQKPAPYQRQQRKLQHGSRENQVETAEAGTRSTKKHEFNHETKSGM